MAALVVTLLWVNSWLAGPQIQGVLAQGIQAQEYGDPKALEFLRDVVNRRMYNLPAAGMTQAIVKIKVTDFGALLQHLDPELPDDMANKVKAALLWRREPALLEHRWVDLPTHLHDKFRGGFAENLNVFGVADMALMRPVTKLLPNNRVYYAEDGDLIKLEFKPKNPKPKQILGIVRWYTQDGRLVKDVTDVRGPTGPQKIVSSYDTVKVCDLPNGDPGYAVRAVKQKYVDRDEHWEFDYTDHGQFTVVSQIKRRTGIGDSEIETEYKVEMLLNQEITKDVLLKIRGTLK